MVVTAHPTLVIFASDKGPGDAERSSIMSQAGSYFARKGARIVCLAEKGVIAVPLVTSARAAGGDVLIVADETIVLPPALSGVAMEVIADPAERIARIAALADAFIGLPGSLASASSLFTTWTKAGGKAGGKPLVLLNRNRAFEVLRGYAADVLSHSVRDHEKAMQFTDNIEDMWNRVSRMLGVPH
jgi:predicted Rossmann-fold nucleotide-binding protein